MSTKISLGLAHRCAMAHACNGNGQLQWPARVREVIENIEPVNAPSCYRISLLSSSLEVTARLKSVDDLDLLMNVLEPNRAFFVKNDRLAALTPRHMGEHRG
jgi:hypothetical protein